MRTVRSPLSSSGGSALSRPHLPCLLHPRRRCRSLPRRHSRTPQFSPARPPRGLRVRPTARRRALPTRCGVARADDLGQHLRCRHELRADCARSGDAVTPTALAPVPGKGDPDEASEALVDYCARPRCRAEFRRSPGPGRRQAYCSETCRRAAERELRHTRTRLAHFEGVVARLRVDVAAHGRATDEEESAVPLEHGVQRALAAVARAEGALLFAPAEQPLTLVLRSLVGAVSPVLRNTAVPNDVAES